MNSLDIPACSIAPQPSTLPRALPKFHTKVINICSVTLQLLNSDRQSHASSSLLHFCKLFVYWAKRCKNKTQSAGKRLTECTDVFVHNIHCSAQPSGAGGGGCTWPSSGIVREIIIIYWKLIPSQFQIPQLIVISQSGTIPGTLQRHMLPGPSQLSSLCVPK
jgi:hypothetical protein